MAKFIRGALCAGAVLGMGVAPAADWASAPTEFVAGKSVGELIAAQADLHAWLSASAPAENKAGGFRVALNRQDLRDIGALDASSGALEAQPRRVQVGVDKPLDLELKFSAVELKGLRGSRSYLGGTVSRGLGGELVWSANAGSAGASGLRLGFSEMNLPRGAELYVYNGRGEAFGPYTGAGPNGSGEFWSNTISGDEVTLQLHFSGGETQFSFRLASITHMGPRLALADMLTREEDTEKVHCSYNESCVLPASASGSAPLNEAKNAVALMIYNSGGGAYICSGGLMADTDSDSVVPLFLTANHCISKGREAKSLETVFDFDGSCADRYGNGNYPIRTNGAAILSSNRTSDYTLLELDQAPGGTNRAYLGWTSAPVAFSNSSPLYRISHPAGAPQSFAEHEVDSSAPTCTSWPRGSWIYSRDVAGATEGGSSGSPVLNSAGLVVGQLSGACGTNVSVSCDASRNATVDGALAAYYSAVEQYLDPGVTPPPPGGDATVASVSVTTVSQGPWNRAQATVVVEDGSGNPLANASVAGTFSGDVSGSAQGTTDSTGTAVLSSSRTRSAISSVSFCVNTVNGAAATGVGVCN